MTGSASADTQSIEQIGIKNTILGQLRPALFTFIQPYLRKADLKEGIVLQADQKRVEYIDFVESGLVSLQAVGASESADVAFVGRHGMVGTSVLLGEQTPAHRAVVIIAGAALRLHAEDFRALTRDQPQINEALLRHVHPVLVQSAQTALCGVHHVVENRLASWLCLAGDALGEAIVPLRDRQLAGVLGADADVVSEALNSFETQGWIRKTKSGFEIQDRASLEQQSCDCREIVTRAYKSVRQS